jgi:hypothetical protein
MDAYFLKLSHRLQKTRSTVAKVQVIILASELLWIQKFSRPTERNGNWFVRVKEYSESMGFGPLESNGILNLSEEI